MSCRKTNFICQGVPWIVQQRYLPRLGLLHKTNLTCNAGNYNTIPLDGQTSSTDCQKPALRPALFLSTSFGSQGESYPKHSVLGFTTRPSFYFRQKNIVFQYLQLCKTVIEFPFCRVVTSPLYHRCYVWKAEGCSTYFRGLVSGTDGDGMGMAGVAGYKGLNRLGFWLVCGGTKAGEFRKVADILWAGIFG